MSETDVDFEVDSEDLPPKRDMPEELGDPSVIVDDLHVTYRVVGSRRRALPGGVKQSRLQRLLSRSRQHTGGVTEVPGLIGVNGSGKSTLLASLAGVLPPSGGAAYVSGVPSLLGVNAALMKKLSGERNIMIGGVALGLSRKQVEERFDDIVEFAEIGRFVELPMTAYSAGMAARLRFAISTVSMPDVLMIDEALATGDAKFRRRSRQRIDTIREQAGTVFFVSHSLASVRAMCSRAIWLHEGQIVLDGPVDEVADAYAEFIEVQRDGDVGGVS